MLGGVKKLSAIGVVIAIINVATGCSGGPGDPISACNDEAAAICHRLYECNDATTIQKTFGYSSESDCTSKGEVTLKCSTAGCPLLSKYQPDNANTCLNDYNSQVCNDTSIPTACTMVCQ
jgi:hypothetical protein